MNTPSNPAPKRKKPAMSVREMVVFAMLGTLMFVSKVLMEILPNIHLLGMFTMVFTIVFRKKALIPIYIYVMLNGLFAGFNMWWMPYLYIWTILWGITMLLPKKMLLPVQCVVYPIVCGLHGIAFGTLYAPAQALMFGLTFEQMIVWIIKGLPFDAIHCIGDFCVGILVAPMAKLLGKLYRKHIANR